jgi:hypothetical protein
VIERRHGIGCSTDSPTPVRAGEVQAENSRRNGCHGFEYQLTESIWYTVCVAN